MAEDKKENDAVEAHVVQGHASSHYSPGAIGAMGTATLTGGAGWAATEYGLRSKLLPFDTAVANETVEEIRNLRLTGGLAASGGAMVDGASFAGGVIKEKVYLNKLKDNKLARVLHNLGGRSIVPLGVGLLTAVAGLGIGALLFRSRKKDTMNVTPDVRQSENNNLVDAIESRGATAKSKDWQASVDTPKESQPGRTF